MNKMTLCDAEKQQYIIENGLNIEIDGIVPGQQKKMHDIVEYMKKHAVKITAEEAAQYIGQATVVNWGNKKFNTTPDIEDMILSNDKYLFFLDPTKITTSEIDNEGSFVSIGMDSQLKDMVFMKIKAKGDYKDFIQPFLERGIITNNQAEPENEEEAKLLIDNKRRFLRFNKYETLGKTVYNQKTGGVETVEYKSKKDGKSIPLKTGLLYKCHDCGAYERVEEFEAFIAFRVKTGFVYAGEAALNEFAESICINSIQFSKITCSNCNTTTDISKINFLYSDAFDKGTIASNIFNDYEEKGKIVISNLFQTRLFFGDKYTSKVISNKVVFNINTGRTYILPALNMNTQKRLHPLVQLGENSIHNYLNNFRLSEDQFIYIGLLIEKYLRQQSNVMQKAIIPFKDYVLNAIVSKQHFTRLSMEPVLEQFSNRLANATADNFNIENRHMLQNVFFHSTELLLVLKHYNQNPYYHYTFASNMKTYQDELRSLSKIRKIRNLSLEQEYNKYFKVKTKFEKKFMNSCTNKAEGYEYIRGVKSIIKNQDNINKFLQMQMDYYKQQESHIVPHTFDISKNSYIQALIAQFGETNVTNALTKIEERVEEEKKNNPLWSMYHASGFRNYNLYQDTIVNYNTIITAFPEYQLPCNRLRLKELHDRIAKDATKIKISKRTYEYEDKFMKMYDNKAINNITFHVALSNRKLSTIGSQMNICVGGYWNRVEAGSLFIVYMMKNDEYIGCLEISHDGNLYQAKAKYNQRLYEDELIALREYCLMTNIAIQTSDVPKDMWVDKDATKESVIYSKAIKIKTTIAANMQELLAYDPDCQPRNNDDDYYTPQERFIYDRHNRPNMDIDVVDELIF